MVEFGTDCLKQTGFPELAAPAAGGAPPGMRNSFRNPTSVKVAKYRAAPARKAVPPPPKSHHHGPNRLSTAVCRAYGFWISAGRFRVRGKMAQAGGFRKGNVVKHGQLVKGILRRIKNAFRRNSGMTRDQGRYTTAASFGEGKRRSTDAASRGASPVSRRPSSL